MRKGKTRVTEKKRKGKRNTESEITQRSKVIRGNGYNKGTNGS